LLRDQQERAAGADTIELRRRWSGSDLFAGVQATLRARTYSVPGDEG
jgi:hypothetical protein